MPVRTLDIPVNGHEQFLPIIRTVSAGSSLTLYKFRVSRVLLNQANHIIQHLKQRSGIINWSADVSFNCSVTPRYAASVLISLRYFNSSFIDSLSSDSLAHHRYNRNIQFTSNINNFIIDLLCPRRLTSNI